MARLNTYLNFNGNCRQAMEFYKECLGGELKVMTVGESPQVDKNPPAMKDKVMHSLLTSGTIVLMASDKFGGEVYKPGNTISLCLVCESKEEIELLFSKLSQGGKVNHSLNEEFFGTYGDLVDKFGMGWMFQYSKEPM